jgi:dTDP-4-amino-4,6-dideoxygalactose transaminase
MAHKLYLLRDHGRDEQGEVVTWGTNCRLDNIQAAVLDWKLKTFENEVARRREIASMYQQALGDIDDLVLPPAPGTNARHFDVYQNYELESGHRDALKKYLADQGVGTIIQWGGKAVHQLSGLGFKKIRLPVTEKMTSRFLMLPMHTALSDEDVEYICDCIHDFYKSA